MAEPISTAALIATIGGSALAGGLGSLFRKDPKKVMPSLINEREYRQGLGAAQNAYNQNNAMMQGLLGQAAGYRGQGASLLNQYLGSQTPEYSYDPQAAQRAFLAGAPQLQQLARDTVSDGSTEDLLRQERERIVQEVGDTFGGTPTSGAFAQALGTGIATPLLQRSQAREQMISNLAGNLLGQSQGLLSQNYLNAAQMRYGEQEARLQQLLQGLQGTGALGQQALGEAGQYGQMAQQGLGLLGQLSQPVYATPDYVAQRSPFSDFMTGAAQGAGVGTNIAGLMNSRTAPAQTEERRP